MTELRTDESFQAGEREMLLWFLDEYRRILARKAEGISDELAREALCPPSDLTLLGLVRHMARVEQVWFRVRIGGENVPLLYISDQPDADWHPPADATLAEAFDAYWAEIARADEIIATSSLDDVLDPARTRGRVMTVRWVLVHMVEEYARHCGHADLLRQATDGETGD